MSFFKDLIKGLPAASSIASDGTASSEFEGYVDTGSYSLNAALSGSLFGGMPNNKITALCGDPATGKCARGTEVIHVFIDGVPTSTTYADLYERLATNKLVGIPDAVRQLVQITTPTYRLVPILSVIKKPEEAIVRVILDDGRTFECSRGHLFQNEFGESVTAGSAISNTTVSIMTIHGLREIVSCHEIGIEPTYDIEIPAPHWYVSPNGIIHHNTFFALGIMKQWLADNPTGAVIYCDTESATTNQMLESQGIDLDRTVKVEPETIEQFRQTILQLLDRYDETPLKNRAPMLIVLDSLGNLSSSKEMQDIRDLKDTRDMTKAGLLKGTFRVLRLRLSKLGVPMIVNNHVYANVGNPYGPPKIISGGCLGIGTEVLMSDNKTKAIEKIEVGDEVLTHKGLRKVTHVWNPLTLDDGYPECFEFTWADGTSVIVSENHSFAVGDRWIQAKEIVYGDYLSTLASIGMSGIVPNESSYGLPRLIAPTGKLFNISEIRRVGRKPVYDITVEETNSYALSNGIVCHNSGLVYISDYIAMLSKSKDRDKDKQIIGSIVKVTMYKSRLSKENSQVEVKISYTGGLDRYHGLLEFAEEAGMITSSAGKYTFPGHANAVKANKIAEDPTKYFTPEFLKALDDSYVIPKFSYGVPTSAVIATEDDSE